MFRHRRRRHSIARILRTPTPRFRHEDRLVAERLPEATHVLRGVR